MTVSSRSLNVGIVLQAAKLDAKGHMF